MKKIFDYHELSELMDTISCEHTKTLLINHVNHLLTGNVLTDISDFESESDETPDDVLLIFNYLKSKGLIKETSKNSNKTK